MAWSFRPSSSLPGAPLGIQAIEKFPGRNCRILVKPTSSERHLCFCKAAGTEEGVTEEASLNVSSARTQLDLLEQLSSSSSIGSGYQSDAEPQRPTIREQLSELIGDRDGEFTLPLGKKLKESLKSLTVSQRRNIKRQAYLNEVSRRNDSVFFATIGAFVLVPPLIILAIAVLTGYVQLLP
ncbi:uncharacterized protein [Typha latifolia]|uniref:uncharacterized protein n=1 Tax=Typha latifolia TaxID=4733 RepID=UPI003C2EB2B5